MIVAVVTAPTTTVVIVNVAAVRPAATVTLAGMVAAALLLKSETTAPPEGAGPSRLIVPVDGVPPSTIAGLSNTEATETVPAGFTVRSAVLVTPA